jgi:ribosomal protein L11 methyltransferase
VPRHGAAAIEALLEPGALALSVFEAELSEDIEPRADDLCVVEALFSAAPDAPALAARLGLASSEIEVSTLPERDWVAETQRNFAPVRAGRFAVRASHAEAVPGAALSLTIDAGPAFGTGHHESTAGCLLALDRLARRRWFRRPLDLGTGTGVLAIAMAMQWRVPVLAGDIDPVAARIARENARTNGVGPLVRAVSANGLEHREIAGRAPFDLICANILAPPLRRLAVPISQALAPRGHIVLSGLLVRQEAGVLAAYRIAGRVLESRIRLGVWSTLVLR